MAWHHDDCLAGYQDGRRLDSPEPSGHRSAAYRHGWRCGWDDAEVAAGLRQEPTMTLEQAREAWALIEWAG